jgi:glycosyltransferase involved in cell wall biosynthesis
VVAYRDGALPELVRDNREGLLVPPGDIGALSTALLRLATDPALRARLGAAGHERAREFGHAPFVDRITELYAEMLDANRR